ncbi:MAG: O-antigen ligase family protein, partial [Chloroflexi bacterium]|nr:O-antigen ligase family protein [Chloroflexota bacterium]
MKLSITNYQLPIALVAAVTATIVGALLGFTNVLIATIAIVAIAVSLYTLTNLEIGMWGIVAVIALLPFATLPIKVVLTPTFLDMALLAVLFVYAMQWMSRQRTRVTLTPAHAPIIGFIAMAVFAFVVGLRNGPLTSNLARHFAEFILSVVFTFVVIDYVDDRKRLERMALFVVLCGTMAAMIGIALYFIPENLAERALNALRVIGYPTGNVLQYIESNPELGQRAIGTSVNPNTLGGLLAVVGAVAAPQLTASRPLFVNRWVWGAAFALIAICLVLTFSRTAMLALVAASLLIAARYPKLLWVLIVGALIILILPVTQDYVDRFVQGAQGADLATQMRFGEYNDALILRARYPLLGVGFADAPDIDIYLGVSNAYLAIAQEMGFIGLAVFLLVVAVVFGWAIEHSRKAMRDDTMSSL